MKDPILVHVQGNPGGVFLFLGMVPRIGDHIVFDLKLARAEEWDDSAEERYHVHRVQLHPTLGGQKAWAEVFVTVDPYIVEKP